MNAGASVNGTTLEGLAAGGLSAAVVGLVVLEVENYLNAPEGSKENPVFKATDKNIGVLKAWEDALQTLSPDLRAVLPSSNKDPDKIPKDGFWHRAFFAMPKLRALSKVRGPLHRVVSSLRTKLAAYHIGRTHNLFHWDPESPWWTNKPIEDHILLALLLINQLINRMGAYTGAVSPEDGQKLVQVLRKFIINLKDSGLDIDADDTSDHKVTLKLLLSESEKHGILDDLQKLEDEFVAEEQRTKYVAATTAAEQNLGDLQDLVRTYVIEWLQGNKKDRVSASDLEGVSEALDKYSTYAELRKAAESGSSESLVIHFCGTAPAGETLFLMLKILNAEITLDPADHDQPIPTQVFNALSRLPEFASLVAHPSAGPVAVDVAKDAAKRLAEHFKMIRKGLVEGEAVFLDDKERDTLVEHLFKFIGIYHYLGILKNLLEEMRILGDLVGNLAGAILPKVTTAIADTLGQARVKVEAVIKDIAVLKRNDKYMRPEFVILDRNLAAVFADVNSILKDLSKNAAALKSMTTQAYKGDLKHAIKAQVDHIASLLPGLVGPDQAAAFQKEYSGFLASIDASLPTAAAAASASAEPPIVELTGDEKRRAAIKKIITEAITVYKAHSDVTPAKIKERFGSFVLLQGDHCVYNDADHSAIQTKLADTLLSCQEHGGLLEHRARDALRTGFENYVDSSQKAAVQTQFGSITAANKDALARALLTLVENSAKYKTIGRPEAVASGPGEFVRTVTGVVPVPLPGASHGAANQ